MRHSFAFAAMMLALSGCAGRSSAPPGARPNSPPSGAGAKEGWSLKEVSVLEGLRTPECVVVDPATGCPYLSNIDTDKEGFWEDDGTGFISKLKPGGAMDELKWRESKPEQKLNAPKGMCILDGVLYVTDNSRMVAFPLSKEAENKAIQNLHSGKKLNDLAGDGKAVWVSDTAEGKIHRCAAEGIREIKSPKGINGLAFHKERMFGVSWDLHEVYELDPAGKEEPKPFGLAAEFKNLDGIEALEDGSLLVTDFPGNKVVLISPDRKTTRVLATPESPADLGIDRERGLVFVPLFMKNRMIVYKLERGK